MGLVASTTVPLRKPCPAERSGGAFGRRPSEHAGQGATRSEDCHHRQTAGGGSQRRRSRARFQPCAFLHAPERTVHRYYDPTTGEFLTVEPEVATTRQPYLYAGEDPVNETDPSGMQCTSTEWVIEPGVCTVNTGIWGSGPPSGNQPLYTAYHSLEYGYCQLYCGTTNQEKFVLTQVRTYWDELTPQLDASEAAFDTMLSFVTQNYANQPSSIYFSDCIMGVPSCVGALVQNEGSGPNGFDYQETHDNSINWWMLQLSSSPYFKLISYAEWIDRAELIPTPTEAAGILTSSTVSTGSSNTSDSTGSTCQQV